ncbi:MAG: hypothetical protein HZA04_01835 [Nitrospinae bacterium]|nr:hypothetical protein [Nitrospinota bacterium]
MQFEEYLAIEHGGAQMNAPVVISESLIASGVRRVAGEVADWCGGGVPLQVVSVLNGAKPFTQDLQKELAALGVPHDVHAVKLSNTLGTRSTGDVALEQGALPPEKMRRGRVLIVDDIIDTCATAHFIKRMVEDMVPAEVRIAAVVNKYARHSHMAHFLVHDLKFAERPIRSPEGQPVDYWLFGYGMDLNGKYRELPKIAWVEVPAPANS